MMERFDIKILGGMEIRYGSKAIGVSRQKTKSNKMWVLFEYILLNRNRKIPQDELIEVLWPDMDVQNPSNSLKGLVFRLRKEIDTLGFIPGKQVILSMTGYYAFNTEVPYTIDICQFEDNIVLSKKTEDEEEKISLLLAAIKCYSGNTFYDFSKEPWAVSIHTNYFEQYKDAVCSCCELLLSKERYGEIIDIASEALLIQPFTEDYYYYIISAYAAQDNFKAVSEMYRQVKNFLMNVYGTSPDESLEKLYSDTMKKNPKRSISLDELKSELADRDRLTGFYVDYEVFRHMYMLIKRRLEDKIRDDGKRDYLCLYTLGATKGADVKLDDKITHMKILGNAIGRVINRSDVFSRVTPYQFAVMCGDTEENVMEERLRSIREIFEKTKTNKMIGVIQKYTEI